MTLSQKVAVNTIIQVVSKATTVVFGLLTTILLTNYLGRDVFGDYTYVITLVIMFGAFGDWGTMTIGVREASRAKENQGQLLGNIFLIRLGLAFLAAILMVVVGFFLPLKTADPQLLRLGIMIGSLIMVLFALKASFGIVFQVNLQMQKLAVADIIASLSIFLLSWLFIYQQKGVLAFLVTIILANVLAVLVAWFFAKRTIKFNFKPDKVFIKKLVKESLPMGLILLVFTVDNKIDAIMLGSIKGSGAVGIYGVAFRIYDVLILGAAYLMNALLPVISNYAEIKVYQEKLQKIYQKTFDVLLMMGAGVMILTLVFSPLMIRVITQQRFFEFADAVLVLRILSLALFIAYFNHLTGYTIVALGKQRRYLLIAILALSFNVVANLLVIPHFSYYGAATITVLTEGLVLIITTIFVYRLIKIAPSLRQFPKTALALIKKQGKIF